MSMQWASTPHADIHCGNDSKNIAGFPVEQFRNAIQPNDEQNAALDDLASASQRAAQIIRDSCPKDVAPMNSMPPAVRTGPP